MNIVREANRLLRSLDYSKTGEASSVHCKVQIKVTPLAARKNGDDDQQDPASEVIIHILPLQKGLNYNLFVQAAQQQLGLTFTDCDCHSAGNNLGLSNGSWYPTGISRSFVHSHNCLKAGFKLQLRKHQ